MNVVNTINVGMGRVLVVILGLTGHLALVRFGRIMAIFNIRKTATGLLHQVIKLILPHRLKLPIFVPIGIVW